MKVIETNKLSSAVRVALTMGVATTAGFAVTAQAQNAESDAPKNQNLETIVVTGSNLRRIDMETANPVVTIDRAAIAKSGRVTLGDLVQDLPSIAGNATNPRVNNGGGDGSSAVNLRGLGTQRSLLLVDGRRLFTTDINMIPASMVERIEVLSDGASAVYGSDAIGGVINFILRKNYQGAELSTQYGISDRDDGATKNFSLIFGQSTDKGSLLGGIEYNKNEQILAGNRDYSKHAYNKDPKTGAVTFTGSAASPTGFITAPQFMNCPSVAEGGGPGGTLDPNAPGGNGIPKGFRCFVGGSASGLGDLYEFAPVNVISTNGERTNAFLNGNYKITDSVEAYMTVLHNKTTSNAQLAPTAFALSTAGLTISSNNPYNPFGVALGAGSADGYDDSVRGSALGPRLINYTTTNDQVLAGVKGRVADTTWTWDANINYAHYSQNTTRVGLPNSQAITSSGALGDNCIMPVAGQPLTTKNCLNIMNQNDPTTAALIKQFYSLQLYYHNLQTMREFNLSTSGDLFELPGGTATAAAGFSYRKNYATSDSDTITHRSPGVTSCGVPNSACSNPFSGGYNVKEVYVEALVPIVKDMAFAKSLNLVLGDRYSKYSTVGSTNNWKAAIEYKPFDELLLRGTVSKVFRAPNMTENFLPQTTSFDAYVAPNANLISKNGKQVIVNYSGAQVAGIPLSPEKGSSFDFGAVYDPQWLPGLSVSVDLWRIYLTDLITRPTGQTIANYCAAGNQKYCNFITYGGGKITSMNGVPYVNLGRLDTKGADLGVKYRLPETSFGNFTTSLQATYLSQYDNTVPGLPVVHVAGRYNNQFGSFPRWRAVGGLDWNLGNISANWKLTYIGGEKIPALGTYGVGAWVRNDVSVGYNIEPLNTRVDVGIYNLGDKQPPMFYQAVTNANVDVNTYDTIGRYFWGRVTLKF